MKDYLDLTPKIEEKIVEQPQPIQQIIKQNRKDKTIRIIVGILFIIIISLSASSVYAYLRFNQFIEGGEWTCIAEECVEYVTGDEWVKEFCYEENEVQVCKFIYQEEEYKMLLSQLNISKMGGCKTYKCSTKVYLKGGT